MSVPIIINRMMKINGNTLWIRDLEDFLNELYFQNVISQNDKDYMLDLLLIKHQRDIIRSNVDLSCIKESVDDARASLDRISTELIVLENETEADNE